MSDHRVDDLIKHWSKRNISGLYCGNKNQAVDKLLEIIPADASIGMSGSATLGQLGIIERLKARGNKVFNQYKPGLSREESLIIRKQGIEADYYLASANAISGRGELVFFSAYSNRTAGVCSAKNLIVVCGINKVVADLNKALRRGREYVTPLNCKRLNWESACFKEGICRKEICLFPEYKRMCCQILIIEAEVEPNRVKVVLVGENLGF